MITDRLRMAPFKIDRRHAPDREPAGPNGNVTGGRRPGLLYVVTDEVPGAGFEPARPFGQGGLSTAQTVRPVLHGPDRADFCGMVIRGVRRER